MDEEIQLHLEEGKDLMEKALKHTNQELSKVRAGRANPVMLEGIKVDYYGVSTPLGQVATVGTPDARTIAIKPFEKKLTADIEKAIRDSHLGLAPQNNGESIIISIPPLTEERRKALVKQVKQEIEAGKVGIRNIRKETNEGLRKLQKEGAPEDAVKKAEDKVQVLTDSYITKIDALFTAKEAEIMTV